MGAGQKEGRVAVQRQPGQRTPEEFVLKPSGIVTQPPDNQEAPPARVRDPWISAIMLAEIFGAVAIAWSVSVATLTLADRSTFATVVMVGTDLAAVFVVFAASWLLVRGVRVP